MAITVILEREMNHRLKGYTAEYNFVNSRQI